MRQGDLNCHSGESKTMSIFTKKRLILYLAGCSTLLTSLSLSHPAYAYRFFFGEDLNNSEEIPLPIYPNATTAETNFLAELSHYRTEDFEAIPTGEIGPLNLDFGPLGMATLNYGQLDTVDPGTTNGVGRYGASGVSYWEANATGGNFIISFSQSISALGFYGIDLGDFGGQLTLNLTTGGIKVVQVPNTAGIDGSTGGSVLYVGLIAQTTDELFNSVSFNLIGTSSPDLFALDNLTIGRPIKQPTSPPTEPPVTVPEPTSVMGILALGLWGIRSRQKRQ